MKMKCGFVTAVLGLIFWESGWAQWRLERVDEPHELRLDRSLPGVFNAGANLNGRWVTRADSERRQRPGDESYFMSEAVSVFWENGDYGFGNGAPSGFGDEMSGARGVPEMEFFFGEFMETGPMGLELGGVTRVFAQHRSMFSYQGFTFRLVNETGQALKGLRVDLELLHKGGEKSPDLPKLELQISREEEGVYETFAEWMPTEPKDLWQKESLRAEVAEEIPVGGTVYLRIWTGIGTGPQYARVGWTRLALTPLGGTPTNAGERKASKPIEARSLVPVKKVGEAQPEAPGGGGEAVVVAEVRPEPVGGERAVTEPAAPVVSPAAVAVVTPAVVSKGNGGMVWVVGGLVVVGLGLLGGCGFALWRMAQGRAKPEDGMMG